MLHLLAVDAALQVEVEFVLPPQVRAVSGGAPWVGALAQNATIDLPLTIEIAQEGEYSVGALVKSGLEIAGATLNIVATAQEVQLSSDPIFLMRLRAAQTEAERQKLLTSPASPAVVAPRKSLTPPETQLDQFFWDQFQRRGSSRAAAPGDASPSPRAATTVSGNLTYQDTAGVQHPIRYALVQILDGTTDALLPGGETLTLSDGSYSASVNAASVKVKVFTEDGLRAFVRVNPLGLPGSRYAYTSNPTPVSGPTTTVSFTTDLPVRGTPGAPSVDAIAARAFSVLDALMQYQVQAYGLRGSFMSQTKANFPNGAGSPCPTISCYSPSVQEMYILREDGLDWDVIGHEFFHYVTNQGAARPIDNNPGGAHSGGSAIGQNGRNRDQGMRLAWSEGLATFMSIRLQNEPTSTDYGMTWPTVPNVGDTHYQDTEDSTLDDDLETIGRSEGFGSENSVMAMFWDFTDTPGDLAPLGAKDKFDESPKTIWDLINSGLTCNPCDRVDRFWNAVFGLLGAGPTLVDVAETLAMNYIGPELAQPDNASLVSGGVSPTFMWNANGDPAAAHKPNRFFLVVSKDNFQSDLHLFPSDGQPIQTTQYQIPDGDFRTLVSGALTNTVFTWVVIGYREADTDIRIPEGGGFLVSNSRTFTVRAYHAKLTWTTLGADVDLHFRPPDGAAYVGWRYFNDAAYYNRTPDWGVIGDTTDNPSLDRDCITSCIEENITIDKVTTPGTYKVLAHYYRDHRLGPTTATVQIFQNGTQIFIDSQVLTNSGDTPDGGTLWTVLSFTVTAGGKIEVSGGGEVTKAGSSGDLPAHLKKE